MSSVVVSATVVLPAVDQEKIVRAAEALARVASGLALEGISVNVTYGVVEDS